MARIINSAVVVVFVASMVAVVCGCSSMPSNTRKKLTVGPTKIIAVGAGLAKADARTTTYKIRCADCGFEDEEARIIATPTAAKPYGTIWVCPKCAHRQNIDVKVMDQHGA